MKKELSILCVEDVADDVVMLNHALRAAGMSFRSKRVETQAAFLHELEHHPPDVILSDHGLPSFDGFIALAIAREKCPEIPFIFVTGKLGEQLAIETLKGGATDYVLKSNLRKLAPAIERALREAEQRAALKQQELQLRESEERYRQLVELCPDAFLVQCKGEIVFANRTAARLLGAEDAQQLVGKPIREVIHSESLPSLETRFNQLLQDGTIFFWRKIDKGKARKQNEPGDDIAFTEEKLIRPDGSPVEVEVAATPLLFHGRPAIQILARDIRARKRIGGELYKSQELHRQLVERCAYAVIVIFDNDRLAFANPAAVQLLGAKDAAELAGRPATEIFVLDPWDLVVNQVRKLRNEQRLIPWVEQKISRLDGTTCDVEISAAPIPFQGRPAVQVIVHEISEQPRPNRPG